MPAWRPNLLSLTMSSASSKSSNLIRKATGPNASSTLSLVSRSTSFEQGRLEHRAVALAAAEQGRALGHRLLDPAVEPLRLPSVDHRADEDVAVLGIAGDQRLGLRDQHVAEFVIDVVVDQDALDADAALAGLVEGAEDDPLERVVEVGVRVDDHRRIAAELEHHLLLAGLGLEVPADAGRAGEAQQLQPLVGGEQVGALAVRGQDREGALGQIGLGQHLAHDDRAERRAAGRLHHERAADRERRRDLVRGEVEREVERRDEAARPDRHALPDALIALGARARCRAAGPRRSSARSPRRRCGRCRSGG